MSTLIKFSVLVAPSRIKYIEIENTLWGLVFLVIDFLGLDLEWAIIPSWGFHSRFDEGGPLCFNYVHYKKKKKRN